MSHYIKDSLNQNKKAKFILILIIILQLIYIANKKINFSFDVLVNSFQPNYGSKYIFPENILELKIITEKEKFTYFNISKKLKNDVYFYQRSVEYLYPIRFNEKFERIFFSVEEKIPNTCILKKKYKHFILAQC
tara:strand:- start:6 stop:407 length:402 start_codon:yes stop_codon:yes gene_type:complete